MPPTNPLPESPASGTGAKENPPDGGKPRRRSWLRYPRSWAEVRALGWKAIAAFVLFYLIRDLILYVLIPYLAYRGLTK